VQWLICLVLAALLVCVPGGTKSTYAGKKRRDVSIDRLRERSASDRWKSLQKLWQPFSDDATSSSVATPADTSTSSTQDSTAAAHEGNGETAAAEGTSAAPVPLRTVPSDDAARPVPSREFRSTSNPAGSANSVWFIDSRRNEITPDVKKSAEAAVMTSLQAPLSPAEEMQQRMAEAANLKPITEILPFHDYIPAGTTDPGDELCLDGGDGTNCPKLDTLPDVGLQERAFAEIYVAWEPTNLFSNPLYFEDASLERYGHTHGCVQPLVSLGKFGVQLVGLPYQMALHPIHEHRYALGWYRPGECAPKKYYLPPWNTKAAITAGAAYTGLIFLIP
jgi:hypothetical protein